MLVKTGILKTRNPLLKDLMHYDVTRPEGRMGVVVTLKSKMAANSASSGGKSKLIVSFDLSESSKKKKKIVLAAATRRPRSITTHVSITAI